MDISDRGTAEVSASPFPFGRQVGTFEQGDLQSRIAAPFGGYLRRLITLMGQEAEDDELPIVRIPVDHDILRSINYHFEPADIAFALKDVFFQAQAGQQQRLLKRETLYKLSRALGYYNLYGLLLDPDYAAAQYLLEKLCDLVTPSWQVDMIARSLDVMGRLDETYEFSDYSSGEAGPDDPSWISTNDFAGDITGENARKVWEKIIEAEMYNLLRFRDSLYMAVSAYAPPLVEEEERGQLEHLSLSESRGHTFEVLAWKYESEGDQHIVQYRYLHPSLSQWVEAELAFNSRGTVLVDDFEEE